MERASVWFRSTYSGTAGATMAHAKGGRDATETGGKPKRSGTKLIVLFGMIERGCSKKPLGVTLNQGQKAQEVFWGGKSLGAASSRPEINQSVIKQSTADPQAETQLDHATPRHPRHPRHPGHHFSPLGN